MHVAVVTFFAASSINVLETYAYLFRTDPFPQSKRH